MEILYRVNNKGNRFLEINNARIIFKNFKGSPTKVNPRGGEIGFSVVIPNKEMADELANDINEFGVGWNVRILEPRDEGEEPLLHLPIKVRFNEWGPNIHLISNGNRIRLDEESVGMLDDIIIGNVDLDIRASDTVVQGTPYRTGYLAGMRAYQVITDRFDNDEY
jgi:hypothetical protein